MSIKPQYNTLVFKEAEQLEPLRIKPQCRTEILSESVSKILSVSASSYAVLEPHSGESAKYVGKTVFYICYLDNDGNFNKCECGSEFSGELKSEENCDLTVCAVTEKTEADLSGINLTVSAVVTIKVRNETEKEISFLSGGEDVIVNEIERETLKTFKLDKGNFTFEDEFVLDYEVKEVLCHKAVAVVTNLQCGVGTVIVDGEMLLSAIILPNGENSDIIKENKSLPFRFEVEYEDAMPTLDPYIEVFVKSFKTDITVNENGGKSTVNVNAVLSYSVKATLNETINVADDAFSVDEEIKTEKEVVSYKKFGGYFVDRQKISVKASAPNLINGDSVIALYNEQAQAISVNKTEDGVSVSGSFTAECIAKGVDGVYSFNVETPFIYTVPQVLDGETNVNIFVCGATAKPVSVDEIEISCEFISVFSVWINKEFSYIKEITSCGEKQKENSGISVYIPYEGEELWSLSKRLNVCPDALIESNKELQFPLSGRERIVIFRRK